MVYKIYCNKQAHTLFFGSLFVDRQYTETNFQSGFEYIAKNLKIT